MRRALLALGLSVWGGAVFWGVLWLAFPSAVAGDRLAHEVKKATNGRYELAVDGVSPWWTGAVADHVIVSRRGPLPDDVAEPLFFADRVAASLSVWQLATRVLAVSGYVRLGGEDLAYEARAGVKDGALEPRRVTVTGQGIPLEEVLGLGGLSAYVSATGPVDIDLDVGVHSGLDKATGKVELHGKDLRLDTVTAATMGWENREFNADIEELAIAFAIDEGEAVLTEGVLLSSLFDVEVDGKVDLATELGRSRVKAGVVLELDDWTNSPLDTYRSVVEGFLGGAKWEDGTYHYGIDATLSRLSFSDLRPERDRAAVRSPVSTPVRATAPAEVPTYEPPPQAPTPPTREAPPEVEPEPEPLDDELEAEEEEVEPKVDELEDY